MKGYWNMTSKQRKIWSALLYFIPSASKRTELMKKKHLYGSIGEMCIIQKRKLPLYSNLVFLHNNVKIASNVGFVTHDIIHTMLNHKYPEKKNAFIEKVGCIEIMDNVFIGSGTRILYNTRIGSNVIIGSDSLVNKDVPDNSVYAGVPARFICTFDEYVQKASDYSSQIKEKYGIDKFKGISDDFAKQIYNEFINSRNLNKGE